MKKFYFLYFPVILALAGCKNEESGNDEQHLQKQESVVQFKVHDSTIYKITQLPVPELRDSVNYVFLKNYKAFTEDYLRAMQKNDSQKIKALRAESEEWAEKNKVFVNKLNSEDLRKVDIFMQQLSEALSEVKQL
ncbi:hypothetical protein [Avrilella dinanensis]|uniref:hypothetical protein n=1 Tax=Avrilella dinanensis TaxID=2008672 RepID=UPI0024096E8B|nr:hypothetical protein [Avrilella dinanensis]